MDDGLPDLFKSARINPILQNLVIAPLSRPPRQKTRNHIHFTPTPQATAELLKSQKEETQNSTDTAVEQSFDVSFDEPSGNEDSSNFLSEKVDFLSPSIQNYPQTSCSDPIRILISGGFYFGIQNRVMNVHYSFGVRMKTHIS